MSFDRFHTTTALEPLRQGLEPGVELGVAHVSPDQTGVVKPTGVESGDDHNDPTHQCVPWIHETGFVDSSDSADLCSPSIIRFNPYSNELPNEYPGVSTYSVVNAVNVGYSAGSNAAVISCANSIMASPPVAGRLASSKANPKM